jgi:hypothetical protein
MTAVAAKDLGQSYTNQAILLTLSQNNDHVRQKATRKAPVPADIQGQFKGAAFNTRVRQLLSALFQSHPDPDDFRQGEDQHLRHRHRR